MDKETKHSESFQCPECGTLNDDWYDHWKKKTLKVIDCTGCEAKFYGKIEKLPTFVSFPGLSEEVKSVRGK